MRRLLVLFAVVSFDNLAWANRCSEPSQPDNGLVTCPSGTGHFSLCVVQCNAGYVISGPSRQMCWCRGNDCEWKGGGTICEPADCDMPSHDAGRVLIADQWPRGFGGIIEIGELPENPGILFGWSIVIVFDRPLGKNVSISSWNTKLSTSSYDGQTFTLVNAPHNEDLDRHLNGKRSLKVLFVLNNIESSFPLAAYVGLYNTKIRDASCVLAPRMPGIQLVGSASLQTKDDDGKDKSTPTSPPKTTTTTISTTTRGKKTTKAPVRRPPKFRRPKRRRNRNRRPKKRKMTTTATSTTTTTTTTTPPQTLWTTIKTTATTTQRSTTRRTTTSAPTTVSTTTTTMPSKGRYCVLQRHPDAYVSEKSWTDRGNHSFSANAKLNSPERLEEWTMVIVFDAPVKHIQVWAARIIHSSVDGRVWTFGPFHWDTGLNAGETRIDFIATTKEVLSGSATGQIFLCSDSFTDGDALMKKAEDLVGGSEEESLSRSKRQAPNPGKTGGSRCSKTAKRGSPVTNAPQTPLNFAANNDGTKYNYNELLHKSILFFEAQRSGKLPPDQRVPWRGDSSLKDGCDAKVDASGGWYDAGNFVKYNFPLAFSLTTLAWGGIAFRDAYKDAGELQNMINAIKFPTRYLIKCHTSKFEFIGQVGDAKFDDGNWGRPEEMTIKRPTYKITANKPGTELAAEAAAALAASSIFLKPTDPDLSSEALRHAKELYEFATIYRGMYHLAIPAAAPQYQSYSGYDDELVWAAAWMHKATNDIKYLKAAGQFYQKINGRYSVEDRYAWDRKLVGAQVLLAEITGNDIYRTPLSGFLNNLETSTVTPKGMYFLDEWGPNRYTSGAAFIALVAGTLTPHLPREQAYMRWANEQMGMILGDTGRSFVIGFGKNYPKNSRHRASSCPPFPQKCDWSTFSSPNKNHYILYGALVGGTDEDGVFHDDRENAKENHVAVDYNAVFQSAIAGMKHFAMKNRGKVAPVSPTQAGRISKPVVTPKGTPKPPTTPVVTVLTSRPTLSAGPGTTKPPATTHRPQETRPPISERVRCARTSPTGVPVRNAPQTTLNFKPNNDGTKHNYNEALHLSLLFFEAQRAGRLPPGNRIPWRGDSMLKDGCRNGADVSGGWFDAGDHVKFGFPMAFSLTTLAWGGITFRDAYEDSGELQHMINTVKWGADFFIKAHTAKYELIGQVGNGKADHGVWGRPETMGISRPVYKITAKKPGSELAAEAAAGLAASSIFLKDSDPTFAANALKHAEELYEFANKYRGLYHKSIKDAEEFYKSVSGFDDELIWGAAWLYKATKKQRYLTMASNHYNRISGKYVVETRYSWDRKLCGAQALLGQLTGSPDYTGPFFKMIDGLMRAKTTPQGLFFLTKWGSNRYAAGAAFMAAIAAQMNAPRKAAYKKWAQKQVDLLLGDAGKSFVVGFGRNYPKRPHHRASSCPPYPRRCDWGTFNSPAPNHYVLYGALVGGPDAKGGYKDRRSLYEQTEVTTDYNACFQSAVAGVKHFAMKSRGIGGKAPTLKPPSTPRKPPTSKKPTYRPPTQTKRPTPKPGGKKPRSGRDKNKKPGAGNKNRGRGKAPGRPRRPGASGRSGGQRRPGATRRPGTTRRPRKSGRSGTNRRRGATRKPGATRVGGTKRPGAARRPGSATGGTGKRGKGANRRASTKSPGGTSRPTTSSTEEPCKPPKSQKCLDLANGVQQQERREQNNENNRNQQNQQ